LAEQVQWKVGGRGALRVPEIALAFWAVKALSTAMGESTSEALVNSSLGAEVAVAAGSVAFVAALAFQFKQGCYRAWPYWLSVCMVGVFGTMAADVMHVALHRALHRLEHLLRARTRGSVLLAVAQ
jgi:uncharacterized membrane-anchored protein